MQVPLVYVFVPWQNVAYRGGWACLLSKGQT